MMEVIGLLLPVFAIVALGRAVVRFGLMDAAGIRGINDFTVKIAFPALLFVSLAEEKSLQLSGIASVYLAGCLVVYSLALLLARLVLRLRLPQGAAFALNATYGSAAYIALPIVSTAFGAPGLVLLLPIIALHSGVLLPLAAVLIEWGGRHGDSAVIGNTLKGVLRNPIVLSIALGFLWHAGRLPMPVPAHALFRLLAQAAPALALFCVGASLPQAASGYNREAALAAVCKLAALPAAIGMAAFAAGLSGLPVKVALVTAVMPTGANAFLVARRAPAFADASARTVVITLFAALPILSGLLFWLGR